MKKLIVLICILLLLIVCGDSIEKKVGEKFVVVCVVFEYNDYNEVKL